MQCPDIVRMLRAPLDPAAQAKILAVDLLRFLKVALFDKKSAQRVPRRMHPGPRLVVRQRVVPPDALSKVDERFGVVSHVIFHLAIHHSMGHR